MKTGDSVRISLIERVQTPPQGLRGATWRSVRCSVTGRITLASSNEKSLILAFEGILGGHVGMMAVLRDITGVYCSLATGQDIEIEPCEASDE